MSREMVMGEGRPLPALQVRVEELQTLIAGSELDLLLDVFGVTRIDTAGLGVLVGASRRLQLVGTDRWLFIVDGAGNVTTAVGRSRPGAGIELAWRPHRRARHDPVP